MKKLLKPGDVLLLGLVGIIDVYEEVRDPFGIAAYGAKEIYGWVPRRFKKHNLSRVVNNRIKTGELEKVTKHGEVYLRLTSAGEEKIVRDFPMLAFVNKKWDQKWRVVIFDIAEVNKIIRNSLRNKLRELGFGMLQESVWVTPHDIGKDMQEFLESKNLSTQVFVLEVSSLLAGKRELLLEKIWHLQELNDKYRGIIEMYARTCDRMSQPTSNNVEKIREKYLQIYLGDPCLPKELLPGDWAGEKAREMVKKLPRVD